MLNEDSSNSISGISNILGQFGLGVGSSESNIDKIIELSRARIISQSALFKKSEHRGNIDYFANHLILCMEEAKIWNKKGLLSLSKDEYDLENFRFTHDSIAQFTMLENKALKTLYQYLVGKEKTGSAFQSDYSELSGIMNLSLTTNNPSLSIDLVNQIYDELDEYYFKRTADKQKQDYDLIKSKYDSITTELSSVQYALAQFEDTYQGLYRKQDAVRERQLKGEELKLGSMIAEAEKQLQIAQIALENYTPYVQLIDRPLPPLKPINKGRLYYFLFGGLIGGILSIAYIILRKAYIDIMSS